MIYSNYKSAKSNVQILIDDIIHHSSASSTDVSLVQIDLLRTTSTKL